MKRMLTVPIFASILLLGFLAIGLSFDVAYGGHTISFEEWAEVKTKGLAICETDQGEFCGAGKMISKLRLTVTEVNKEGVSGTAEMKLVTQAGLENDTFISNNLSWTFDSATRNIYLSGFAFDDEKSPVKVEINGWFVPEPDSDQSEMFMKTTLTEKNGNTITGFTAGASTDILELVGGKDKVEN